MTSWCLGVGNEITVKKTSNPCKAIAGQNKTNTLPPQHARDKKRTSNTYMFFWLHYVIVIMLFFCHYTYEFVSALPTNNNIQQQQLQQQKQISSNKQTYKQTNKQTNKQSNQPTNKQASKQANKQTSKQANIQTTAIPTLQSWDLFNLRTFVHLIANVYCWSCATCSFAVACGSLPALRNEGCKKAYNDWWRIIPSEASLRQGGFGDVWI